MHWQGGAGAEAIVENGLKYLAEKGFKDVVDGTRIPPDAEACRQVEELLLKLRKTGNYNICEKVSNFEEKVMHTYYERQFKKKGSLHKVFGKNKW